MKKFMTCSIGMIAIVAASVAPSGAVEYVDIDQPLSNGGFRSTLTVQQTFIPSADNITAVSVFVLNGATDTITLQILDGFCGALLAQGSGTGQDWVKCDLTGAQALIPGNTYTISIDPTVEFLGMSNANPYPDGDSWRACTTYLDPDRDLQFRTWTDTDVVPAESTVWSAVKAIYR